MKNLLLILTYLLLFISCAVSQTPVLELQFNAEEKIQCISQSLYFNSIEFKNEAVRDEKIFKNAKSLYNIKTAKFECVDSFGFYTYTGYTQHKINDLQFGTLVTKEDTKFRVRVNVCLVAIRNIENL